MYNERSALLFTLPSSTKPGEGLKGYTSNSVSIQRGGLIYTYNEKGASLGILSAGR